MWHPVWNAVRRRTGMAAALRRFARDTAGNPAVEFGLLLPALLTFVFGIAEGGRLLWTVNALHYSVQEAARCASINRTTCGSSTQIQNFAAGRSGAGFDSSVFTATVAGCGNRVSASYTMPLNIPFMAHSISLSAQSCYPI
jgi:Flp pilus assembly protein TadG